MTFHVSCSCLMDDINSIIQRHSDSSEQNKGSEELHYCSQFMQSCETWRRSIIPFNPVLQQDGNNLAGASLRHLCRENMTLLKARFLGAWVCFSQSSIGTKITKNSSLKWSVMLCCFSCALFSLSGFNCVINHSSVIHRLVLAAS